MSQPDDIPASATSLAEKKRLLLQKRLSRSVPATSASTPTITPQPANSKALASLGQQRIWLLDRISGDSPSFNVTSSFAINSPVDADALEIALNKVIARHEVLRSWYSFEDSELLLHRLPTLELTIEKLSCDDPASLEGTTREFVRKPFNIGKPPLLRMALISAAEDRHILTLSIHDIIFDKWSIKLFWKEFTAFYEQETLGTPAAVPELPIQFADFSRWQRDWIEQSGQHEKQLAYWRKQLADPPPPIDLPTDRPYGKTISDIGALCLLYTSPSPRDS